MFRRLNKCKAWYNHIFIGDGHSSSNNRYELFQLQSYSARVLQAIYDCKYDSWHISLNERYYLYSRTTIQHIYKFIREFDIPITSLAEIRDNCIPITPDVSVYYITDKDSDIEVSIYSDSAFKKIWR